MLFTQPDKRFEVGDAFLSRIRHMPHQWNSGGLAGGLKQNLIIRAVVYVQDNEPGTFAAGWPLGELNVLGFAGLC